MSYSLLPHELYPTRLFGFMRLSSQEYWSGVPFPTPGDLSDTEIKSEFLAYTALAGRLFIISAAQEDLIAVYVCI